MPTLSMRGTRTGVVASSCHRIAVGLGISGIEGRELGMEDVSCGCWCGLVHPGNDVCQGRPTTVRKFLTYGEVTETLMCPGCAGELDRLRAEFGTRKEDRI